MPFTLNAGILLKEDYSIIKKEHFVFAMEESSDITKNKKEIKLMPVCCASNHRIFATQNKPYIIRLTLKGYSLYHIQEGKTAYFTFNKAKERVVRRPNLLLSVTYYF